MRTVFKNRHRRLGVVAFLVLLLSSGINLATWQLRNPQIASVHDQDLAPVIKRGDLIVIRPSSKSFNEGDIVTYHDPGHPQLLLNRRVTGFNETTKSVTVVAFGKLATQSIDSSLIAGSVKLSIFKLGYILDFLRSVTGLLCVVYLPALLILWNEVIILMEEYKPSYKLTAVWR